MDEEMMRERWQDWAEETGYNESGFLKRAWIRLTARTPNRFGNVPPILQAADLHTSGLEREQIENLAEEN